MDAQIALYIDKFTKRRLSRVDRIYNTHYVQGGINSIFLKPSISEKNPKTCRFLFLNGRLIRSSPYFCGHLCERNDP
jgi:hypothetical protein